MVSLGNARPPCREFSRVFLFWLKAALINRKKVRVSSTRGFEYTSILRMAESTFGSGKKLDLPTFAMIWGLPKICTSRESMEWSPASAQIFSATSFWTKSTISEGRFWSFVCGILGLSNCELRKWFKIGEVM